MMIKNLNSHNIKILKDEKELLFRIKKSNNIFLFSSIKYVDENFIITIFKEFNNLDNTAKNFILYHELGHLDYFLHKGNENDSKEKIEFYADIFACNKLNLTQNDIDYIFNNINNISNKTIDIVKEHTPLIFEFNIPLEKRKKYLMKYLKMKGDDDNDYE